MLKPCLIWRVEGTGSCTFTLEVCCTLWHVQEQERQRQEQMEQMQEELQELQANNKHLARKQHLMLQLVELQEQHLWPHQPHLP